MVVPEEMDSFYDHGTLAKSVVCRSVHVISRCGPQGHIIIVIFALMNQWIAAGLLLFGALAPLKGQ